MEPLSIALSAAARHIAALLNWDKILEHLRDDALSTGAKQAFNRFRENDRQKTARLLIATFIEAFHAELKRTVPFTSALPGYLSDLKVFVDSESSEILDLAGPLNSTPDPEWLEHQWGYLRLSSLPETFGWEVVNENYAHQGRKLLLQNPESRSVLSFSLQERIVDALDRQAGPSPGFDLAGYAQYVIAKFGALNLSVLNHGVYKAGVEISLWKVFVAPSVRLKEHARDLRPELARGLQRQFRSTGNKADSLSSQTIAGSQGAARRSVLELVDTERLLVIFGSAGSGKSSLIRFLALRWAVEKTGPLPLYIELKHYGRKREGIIAYLASSCTSYRFAASEIEKRVENGDAALYLDGFDEILDRSTRGAVIEEICSFVFRYQRCKVIVTSRMLGFEVEQFTSSGFRHATLEGFDNKQLIDFVRKWNDIVENDEDERQRLTGTFLSSIRESPPLRELTRNPLLATMATILNHERNLPIGRIDLYRETSRVLLRDWDLSRSIGNDDIIDLEDKVALLRLLAGVMQTDDGFTANLIKRQKLLAVFKRFLLRLGITDAYTKARAIVQQLIDRNGILSYSGAGHFSFVHRTFLDFFSALWFISSIEDKKGDLRESLRELFRRHWRDQSRRELLRLLAGMVSERDLEDLLSLLAEQDCVEDELQKAILAAQCYSEARNKDLIIETGVTLCSRLIKGLSEYCERDGVNDPKESGTRQEGVRILASVWKTPSVRAWVCDRIRTDPDHSFREAALIAFAQGWSDSPDTLSWMSTFVCDPHEHWYHDRTDDDQMLRNLAVKEVARIWRCDPNTRGLLTSWAKDNNYCVRLAALQEFVRCWPTDPETFILLKRGLTDDSWDVRYVSIQELARCWSDNPETLGLLEKYLRDGVRPQSVIFNEIKGLSKNWPEALKLLERFQNPQKNTQPSRVE